MKIENINQFVETHNDIDKIYIDIDGVLWHSCQAMCDLLNKTKKYKCVCNDGSDILSWNFKETNIELTDSDVDELFGSNLFFEYVKWIDGCKEFIKSHENNIIIVTKGTIDNFVQKRKMFDKNGLKNIPIILIPFECSKSIINMENGLFIDDSCDNLVETNAKYKIQFREYDDGKNHKREWIKNWFGDYTHNWY